ncbi:MAG: hypothetical protein GC181_12790 [Bacteroidetes bacterium]|nr:hypothetical protein [Bacteroidota bacterium]
MNKTLLLPIALLILAWDCSPNTTNLNEEGKLSGLYTELDYPTFKDSILHFQKNSADSSDSVVSEFLFHRLNLDIPGYWSGTKWDFNGMTRTPGKGKIACGYFITNTLVDLGFTLERIKLAQSASSVLIKELCVDIKHYSKIENLQNYLKTQPVNSAFIVGLDFHTGYILKDESGTWFMHSNYINQSGVIKEEISQSVALKQSKTFMLGNLLANAKLIEKWKHTQ